MSTRLSYTCALLLLLLAGLLRLTQLADLPAGLHDAEQQTIRLMETARRGTITILFTDGAGRAAEMLGPTVLAVTTVFTGAGPLALRWTIVLIALVTLALVYTLGVRLFGAYAGLAALALLSVTFWPVLLARTVLVEAVVPLLIVVVMLALARAVPVYRIAREESATTTAFATLAAAVGVGFYLHPVGLLVAMGAMVFIVYALLIRRPIERQRLSYIGFSVLIVLILTIPYLVFSVNQPGLAASARLVGDYGSLSGSLVDGVSALFVRGDMNAAHNLPGRPLFDPLSALLILIGLGAALRFIRQARYVLVVLFLLALSPAALLPSDAPNYLGLTVWLVPLALLFGAGVHIMLTRSPRRARTALGAALAVLLGVNIAWTVNDLFRVWPMDERVQQAYRSDLHQLARFLDREMGAVPTVICYPQLNRVVSGQPLNATQQMVLMMNRRPLASVRFVDCNQAMVFPQGGEPFYVVLAESANLSPLHPYVRRWLELGTPLPDDGLPAGRVMRMEVQQRLADQLGVFTTTVTAAYGIEAPRADERGIFPPIRFGGNITWLGNQPDTNRRYRPGDRLDVINYWRVESGSLPPDLQFFTHVLSDPVTVADNRDMISVNVPDLRPRDVLLQVVSIALRDTLLPGTYLISIGAYQQGTLARLPVFDETQQRQSDRLILYSVAIEP